MGFNVVGGVTGSIQEVETATLAARVTERPTDPLTLGSYLLSSNNGTGAMAAGIAANSPIFAFRWGNANLCVPNAIRFSFGTSLAFAAGVIRFEAYIARTYSASDTGGTALTLTTNNAKKRTSFGTTLLTDARISATATLTAGTRTLDANPFGSIVLPTIATNPNPPAFPQIPLYVRDTSDQYPLTLAQNEGFIIQANVPATGTWFFAVQVDWLETATY